METGFEEVIDQVRRHIETSFADEYEVYDISYKPVNRRWVLEVKIDRAEGVTVQDCEVVSHALEKYLDETDLIHRQYDLEVSSPGAERILKRPVDFERHIGRLVRWVLEHPTPPHSEVIRGRLQEYAGNRVMVQIEQQLREIPLDQVREAKAILEFPTQPKRG